MTANDETTEPTDQRSDHEAPGRRSFKGSRRLATLVVVLGVAGSLAAGCSSGGGTATPTGSTGSGSVVTTTVPTTATTTTTVPAGIESCGSGRDPFDPTLAPAPSGSPANC